MRTLTTRAKVAWAVITVVVLVWALLPVVSIIATSFKLPSQLNLGTFWPKTWTTTNYEQIFAGSAKDLFLPALRNSIGISLIATFVAVVLATLAAYAIARLDFRGKKLILTTALGVSIFPPVISIVTPLFNLWRNIGLYDTWLGLIIPYLSLTLPISIWTLAAFFRQIPWELEQAAQVDGATSWQAFRKAIVPLAAPGGVHHRADRVLHRVERLRLRHLADLDERGPPPSPAALAFFTGASQFEEPTGGAISAAAVVVTIPPVVILVLLFQRQIVSGLTQGAVKG